MQKVWAPYGGTGNTAQTERGMDSTKCLVFCSRTLIHGRPLQSTMTHKPDLWVDLQPAARHSLTFSLSSFPPLLGPEDTDRHGDTSKFVLLQSRFRASADALPSGLEVASPGRSPVTPGARADTPAVRTG